MPALMDSLQIGQDKTANALTRNFFWDTDGAGALRLRRGTADTPGAVILTFDSAGNPIFTNQPRTVTTPPQVDMRRITANQSLTASAYTKVQFNSAAIDPTGAWDLTNFRFNPKVAGWYDIRFGAQIIGTGMNYVVLNVYKNGGAASIGAEITGMTTNVVTASGSDLIYMNGSTDFLELFIYVQSSSTPYIGVDTGGSLTRFKAMYVKP